MSASSRPHLDERVLHGSLLLLQLQVPHEALPLDPLLTPRVRSLHSLLDQLHKDKKVSVTQQRKLHTGLRGRAVFLEEPSRV